MTVIPAKQLFRGTRREPVPTDVPASLESFPQGLTVPEDCDGEREGCAWNTPYHLMPGLPCAQRCQLGSEAAGSPAWYRRLVDKAHQVDAPLYMMGPRGGQTARLAFVDRGMLLRDDLVGSVLAIPADETDPDTLMTKSARRDARIGERGGLTVRWEVSDEAIDAYYAVYVETCTRLSLRPLPRTFISHERDRAPEAFRLALAEHEGRVVGGKVMLLADGYLRIIEGSSLREEGVESLMPDIYLSREILREAIAHGVRYVDYGISEGVNEGLRQFKRRMGFMEDPRVVSVERLPEMSTGRQDVSLLEACNFGCGFCYREPWVPDHSTNEAKAEIDVVARLKHSGIALSGGEPTLREDLPELVAYARSRGIRDIQLHTNGWKLIEPGYADELKAAGLTSAMVSLHASTPDVFARVTSTREEYFERTLEAIDRCRESGIHTLLSHVVNEYNYRGLPDWVRFIAKRLPGIEVFFFFVYPSVKGQDHQDMYPRLSEVEPYWYEALRLVDELGIHINVDNLAGFPMCFMKGFEHHSKFFVSRQAEEEIGAEADDHTLKRPEMRHGPGCAGCRWEDVCPGFWIEYMDRFGDAEFQAV
ncbi:MAG: GNAT family N-acetyltransferase [Myxococcota bacterium]|nr:GNAT family N-acetyltransferase [Myxococcota bacterium]